MTRDPPPVLEPGALAALEPVTGRKAAVPNPGFQLWDTLKIMGQREPMMDPIRYKWDRNGVGERLRAASEPC